jgi:Uma2 family endonuclease
MSTPNLTTPETGGAAVVPPADLDRYRYGWRYVYHRRPDGSVEIEEKPLTLEDVLHPQEGDVIPENTFHEPERGYLTWSFRDRLDRVPRGQVLSDCLLDFNVAGLRPLCPDVSLIEGVSTLPLPKLGPYRFAQYGGRCLLAVGIVSPDTRGNDVELKPELYHRGGVRHYIIVDQEREDGPRSVVSRRWTPDGYVVEPPDVNGRVRLDALGLLLGLRDGRVRLYDADTGVEIGDPTEISQAWRREQQARADAEERIRQLEEELRRAPKNPSE